VAGVHLYGNGGEPVYANARFLASHSQEGGVRAFRLPRKCLAVRELFSNQIVAHNCDHFEDTLSAPGTVLYQLVY